eukprot:397550-Pleurochrysis_carterae.AAC.1
MMQCIACVRQNSLISFGVMPPTTPPSPSGSSRSGNIALSIVTMSSGVELSAPPFFWRLASGGAFWSRTRPP